MDDLVKKIDYLIVITEKQNKGLIWYNVLYRGLLAGIGATFGVAILIWLIFFVLGQLDFLPYVDNLLKNLKYLLSNQPPNF